MAVWLKEENNDIVIKTISFLISPFIAFLYSLRRIKTKSSYVIFFLFAVFFGLSFTVGDYRYENTIDGISYRIEFEDYKNVSFNEYYDGLKGFLSLKEGNKDYYFNTIAFYVSRITDNYHVMFMVFAIVFAFFQLKTFKIFTKEDNFNTSLACFILAYLFTINQIFNINGVRFWTAAWIGVFSIFQIFKYGNKKYFLLVLCTPFFHGTFWFFILILFLAYLLKRHEKFWIILFYISFIFSSFSVEIIRNSYSFAPDFLKFTINSYTSNDYINELASAPVNTGLGVFFRSLERYYMMFLVFIFIRNSDIIKGNSKTKNLYLFLLVWMTFVNFVMPVPSFGERYILLAYPLIAYIWLVNFQSKKSKYNILIYILPLFMITRIYQLTMLNIKVLEPNFYYSSPFYLIYKYLMI